MAFIGCVRRQRHRLESLCYEAARRFEGKFGTLNPATPHFRQNPCLKPISSRLYEL